MPIARVWRRQACPLPAAQTKPRPTFAQHDAVRSVEIWLSAAMVVLLLTANRRPWTEAELMDVVEAYGGLLSSDELAGVLAQMQVAGLLLRRKDGTCVGVHRNWVRPDDESSI